MSRATLPQNYQSGTTLIEGFDTFGDWLDYSQGASAISVGTETEDGTGGSLTFTGARTGAQIRGYTNLSSPVDLSEMEYFSLWLTFGTIPAQTFTLKVAISDTVDTPLNWVRFSLVAPSSFGTIKAGKKYHIAWRKADFVAGTTGANDFSSIKAVAIIISGDGSEDFIVTVDNFKCSKQVPRAKFILMPQRGYTSTQTIAIPLFSDASLSRPIVGTLDVAGSVVGTSGYMTLAQIQAMKASGWSINNRGYTSVPYSTLTEEQIVEDLVLGRKYLENNGLSDGLSEYFGTYPAVDYPDKAITAAATAEMKLMAAIDPMGTVQATYPYDRCAVHSEGIAEPLFLSEWGLNKDITPADYISEIDNVIRQGSTYILYMHLLTETPTDPADYDPDDLLTILQHVDMRMTQGLIDIVTMKEWYEGLTQPRLSTDSRLVA